MNPLERLEQAAEAFARLCRQTINESAATDNFGVVVARDILAEADRLFELLIAWRGARPFLHVGASPYAQGLVRGLVKNYRRWVDHTGEPYEQWIVDRFERLLDEQPPPYEPPYTTRVPPNGGTHSFYKKVIARRSAPGVVFEMGALVSVRRRCRRAAPLCFGR
jgi:hypothetical protein